MQKAWSLWDQWDPNSVWFIQFGCHSQPLQNLPKTKRSRT